jgi:hypothetical protein
MELVGHLDQGGREHLHEFECSPSRHDHFDPWVGHVHVLPEGAVYHANHEVVGETLPQALNEGVEGPVGRGYREREEPMRDVHTRCWHKDSKQK